MSLPKLITSLYKPLVVTAAGLTLGLAALFIFDLKIQPSQRFLTLLGREATPSPSPASLDYPTLAAIVTPTEGYTIPLSWGDLGIRLVQAGGIDLAKYHDNYPAEDYAHELQYLTKDMGDAGITVTANNAYFWVNTLWALGLTQQSQVLDEGVMGTEYASQVGSFASTGGWTLGSKEAVKLYSSVPLITLSTQEHARVMALADSIYRPCCNNPTSFPDCNHGMAMLGLLELMVSQGFSDEEIYAAALAVNSYWFPDTYIDLAYYFQTQESTPWNQVDPQLALSQEYSSASGYNRVKKTLGPIPGARSSGASCGA